MNQRLTSFVDRIAPFDPRVQRAYIYMFAALGCFLLGYGAAWINRPTPTPAALLPPDPVELARSDTIRQLDDSVAAALRAAVAVRIDTVKVIEARVDSARLQGRLDSLLAASDSVTRIKVQVAVDIAAAATRAPLVAVIERQQDELVALRRGLLFARRREDLLETSLGVQKRRANALAAERLRLKGRIEELQSQRTIAAGVGFLSGAGFGFLAGR